ncbi:MAG: hypothetical protein V1662_01855 [Candidatus Omnitrophota bacterium]
MYKWLYTKKGQSTGEYALIFAIVLGAAVAMQTYIKRGLQSRIKSGADLMTIHTGALGMTSQYEPEYYRSEYNTARTSDVTDGYYEGRSVVTTNPDTTTREGYTAYENPAGALPGF